MLVIPWGWDGGVVERDGGRCVFPLVMLCCPQKTAIKRFERGCEEKLSQSG